jgi:hypothetical protein
MKKTVGLLKAGFESSSGKTPEFMHFTRVFKKEFTSELKSIGATDINFSVGHFYVSGFFTVHGQAYYFSLSDVRWGPSQLLYRTARDYKDYTGGTNRYAEIKFDMAADMCWYFKIQ